MRLKRIEEIIEMVGEWLLGDPLADDWTWRRLRICLKNDRLVSMEVCCIQPVLPIPMT